jgi:hypothetical protein
MMTTGKALQQQLSMNCDLTDAVVASNDFQLSLMRLLITEGVFKSPDTRRLLLDSIARLETQRDFFAARMNTFRAKLANMPGSVPPATDGPAPGAV